MIQNQTKQVYMSTTENQPNKHTYQKRQQAQKEFFEAPSETDIFDIYFYKKG